MDTSAQVYRQASDVIRALLGLSRIPLSPVSLWAFDYTRPKSSFSLEEEPSSATDSLSRIIKAGGPTLADFDLMDRNKRLELGGNPEGKPETKRKRRREESQNLPTTKRRRNENFTGDFETQYRHVVSGISPYDATFKQMLLDEGVVYPHQSGLKPVNFDELLQISKKRRPSLNDTIYSQEWLEEFTQRNNAVLNEDSVHEIFADVIGSANIPHLCGQIFSTLEPLNDMVAKAKPDHYDGLSPMALKREIRNALKKFIMPCSHTGAPCMPNFFIEKKGPDGRSFVAENQAVYNGVLGARAFQKFLTYLNGHAALDNKAHTISVTFESNHAWLSLYCVHIIEHPDGSHGYKTTYIGGWSLRHQFVEGVTAFRNLREWAEEERNMLAARAVLRTAEEKE